MNADQSEWKIGVSAWIIQDGHYPDFRASQNADFALEFYPKNIHTNVTKIKSAKHFDADKYLFNAEVVYLASDVWVLDFGVSAFQEGVPPKDIALGQFVTAEIHLGIDPFLYFERLYARAGMPPLVYSWKINSIQIITAPFIETHGESGRIISVRDEAKPGFKTIEKTDAWNDDKGNGEYVLNCFQNDTAPKFKRLAAT